MTDRQSQWALITGCSEGGLGDALARAFRAKGINVIASARNTSKIDATLKSLSGVEILELDVNAEFSVAAAVKAVSVLTNGKLEYLVNRET